MAQATGPSVTAKDLLVYIGLPLAGAVLGHLWTRYRRRLATLRWTAQVQTMAFATEDFGWGKVEILYNGMPAGNLHIINVQVVNDSSTDLTDVELDILANDGTSVLRSGAQVAGTLNPIPFASGYAAMAAQSATRTLTPAELAVWGRRADFTIPVLNRDGVVDVRLWAVRADYAIPAVSVHCNHRGVRLRHEPPARQFGGVNEVRAGLLGIMVGIVVVVLTVRAMGGNTWLGVGAWLVGASGLWIGAAVLKVWRWVSRMAS